MRAACLLVVVLAGPAWAFPAPKPGPTLPSLVGSWKLTEYNGQPYATEYVFTFLADGAIATTSNPTPGAGKTALTWAAKAGAGGVHEIDYTVNGQLQPGLFRIKDGVLELLLPGDAKAGRPTDIDTPALGEKAARGKEPNSTLRRLKMTRVEAAK